MTSMRFSLNISAEQYQRYYQGSARSVIVTTEEGRTLKFPANALQQFVTHDGIQGHFEIRFDDQNKLQSVIKLSG
ncbi:MAG: DUF2835 domain-containing protein [Gammaproteobacteria bacterium]